LWQRRGRIGPGVVQRLERGSALRDLVQDVEQIAGRTRQAVEPGDHEHVALAERSDGLA
jgi:hypothetical protein